MTSFCLTNALQCVSQMTLSAFMKDIKPAFNVTTIESNLATSIAFAVFVPAFLAATYMYNNIELRTVQMIAVLVTFVGAWIRLVSMLYPESQFWWIVAG